MDLKLLLDTPPWDWPEDSDRLFHEILINPQANASDRMIAAELAGDFTVINDELVEALLAIVGNTAEPAKLRARAALALGPILEHADTAGFDDLDDVPISEDSFRKIQETLHTLYLETAMPKEVRRRILETAVRAPEDWHQEAVRTAYSSGDREWALTAVFAMRFVRGFDTQILESLKNPDPEIHREAVEAAGNWELDEAWPHVVSLVHGAKTRKSLLIAAIGAAGSIRPREARKILAEHAKSRDEEVAEAADEAIMMAGVSSQMPDDEDVENKWIN